MDFAPKQIQAVDNTILDNKTAAKTTNDSITNSIFEASTISALTDTASSDELMESMMLFDVLENEAQETKIPVSPSTKSTITIPAAQNAVFASDINITDYSNQHQGSVAGNCWLMSTLTGICEDELGQIILNDHVQIESDGWNVRFDGIIDSKTNKPAEVHISTQDYLNYLTEIQDSTNGDYSTQAFWNLAFTNVFDKSQEGAYKIENEEYKQYYEDILNGINTSSDESNIIDGGTMHKALLCLLGGEEVEKGFFKELFDSILHKSTYLEFESEVGNVSLVIKHDYNNIFKKVEQNPELYAGILKFTSEENVYIPCYDENGNIIEDEEAQVGFSGNHGCTLNRVETINGETYIIFTNPHDTSKSYRVKQDEVTPYISSISFFEYNQDSISQISQQEKEESLKNYGIFKDSLEIGYMPDGSAVIRNQAADGRTWISVSNTKNNVSGKIYDSTGTRVGWYSQDDLNFMNIGKNEKGEIVWHDYNIQHGTNSDLGDFYNNYQYCNAKVDLGNGNSAIAYVGSDGRILGWSVDNSSIDKNTDYYAADDGSFCVVRTSIDENGNQITTKGNYTATGEYTITNEDGEIIEQYYLSPAARMNMLNSKDIPVAPNGYITGYFSAVFMPQENVIKKSTKVSDDGTITQTQSFGDDIISQNTYYPKTQTGTYYSSETGQNTAYGTYNLEGATPNISSSGYLYYTKPDSDGNLIYYNSQGREIGNNPANNTSSSTSTSNSSTSNWHSQGETHRGSGVSSNSSTSNSSTSNWHSQGETHRGSGVSSNSSTSNSSTSNWHSQGETHRGSGVSSNSSK